MFWEKRNRKTCLCEVWVQRLLTKQKKKKKTQQNKKERKKKRAISLKYVYQFSSTKWLWKFLKCCHVDLSIKMSIWEKIVLVCNNLLNIFYKVYTQALLKEIGWK